jgi:hypothetical protein
MKSKRLSAKVQDRTSFEAFRIDEIEEMLEEFESIALESELSAPSPPLLSFARRTYFCGVLVNPYVELVDDFAPKAANNKSLSINEKEGITSIQAKQASEIYRELIRQQVTPKEALRMLGPLASEAGRYRVSFNFQEKNDEVSVETADRAFMSLD